MEALRLIYAIKKVVVTIDDATKRYHDERGSLAAIRLEINQLDDCAGAIQAWFDKANASSRKALSSSVESAIQIAEKDVGELDLHLGRLPTSSSSDDEMRVRNQSCDIRETVSLFRLTLANCRLQKDEEDVTKASEQLEQASYDLQHARQIEVQSERNIFLEEAARKADDSLSDLKTFLAEVALIEGSRSQGSGHTGGNDGEDARSVVATSPRHSTNSAEPEMLASRPEGNEHAQATTGGTEATSRNSSNGGPSASKSSAINPSMQQSATRVVSRRPVPSMASTMVPTSPLQDADNLAPRIPGLRDPNGNARDLPPLSSSPPSLASPLRVPDDKIGSPRGKDVDEAPPAYEEEASSSSVPPSLPPRLAAASEDVNTDQSDENGRPYLIKSIRDNLVPVVQVLIERGSDLEAVDAQTQRTAVMEAAHLAREEIVELLLGGGCRLDQTDGENYNALHHAVLGGNPKIVRQLASTDQIGINSRGGADQAPLHLATEFGTAQMVGTLIRCQADPNLKDGAQRAPLHIVASRGSVQVCEALLLEGADVTTYDRDGRTPLEIAAAEDHTAVVEMLLGHMGGLKINDPELLKCLYEAIRNGNVRIAQSCLTKGVNLKKIPETWRPGALASQSGNLDMLRFVIENKASIKDKDGDGWAPIHFAADSGHTGIVRRLLDEKVSPKVTTKNWNETPLHLAICKGHTTTADVLISDKHTDLQATDVDANEPIHHASRLGQTSIVQALLAKGVKPNHENKYGWRPIHLAAAYGHGTLAANLIGGGANIEEKLGGPSYKASKYTHDAIRKGYAAEARWPHPAGRPLALALEFGQDAIVRMLLSHGAKIDGFDVHGWRPLHQAAFACNPEMVELLLQRNANPHTTTNDNNTPLALGFRSAGLNASDVQKDQVRKLLQDGMQSIKPPKFDQLRRGVSFGGNSASVRNKVWDTAETTTTLIGRQGMSAMANAGASTLVLDSLSGSGSTRVTATGGDQSEETSMRSSTTDPAREGSSTHQQYADDKRPSFSSKSPAATYNGPIQSTIKNTPPSTVPAGSSQRPSVFKSHLAALGRLTKHENVSPNTAALVSIDGPAGKAPASDQSPPPPQPPRPAAAVELSTHLSLHRQRAELGGPEIVELAGSQRPAELQAASPKSFVAELPSEPLLKRSREAA